MAVERIEVAYDKILHLVVVNLTLLGLENFLLNLFSAANLTPECRTI
jgi:hypothetical protein